MKSTWLASAAISMVFIFLIWNLLLPFSSDRSHEFAYYVSKVFAKEPVVDPIKVSVNKISDGSRLSYELVGPRQLGDSSAHYVTLTFYVQYGNHQNMQQLMDLLQQYNIKNAVFIMEERYIKGHEYVVKALEHFGYKVKPWVKLEEYDREFPPSVFQDVVLSDKEILGELQQDSDAAGFLNVAVSSLNSSTIAFTPKILSHKVLLEELLKANGKNLHFIVEAKPLSSRGVYDNNNNNNNISYININENYTQRNSQRDNNASSFNDRINRLVILDKGKWSFKDVAQLIPDAIIPINASHGSGYMVGRPIVIEQGAELSIDNMIIYMNSSTMANSIPVSLEVNGKLSVSNSSIVSWDSALKEPDPNPYHPRPFILARDGGIVNISNSSLKYLGFAQGGFNGLGYPRAAIEYHNTENFEIVNSTLAFNYAGVYLENIHNFKIIKSNVYGQTSYGLSFNSSRDFTIDTNYIEDNGDSGIVCTTDCFDALITHNFVNHNLEGINLHHSASSMTIVDNTVKSNTNYGLTIKSSSHNLIEYNTFDGNRRGIALLNSSIGNTLRSNKITNNIETALVMDHDSNSNAISDNFESRLARSIMLS